MSSKKRAGEFRYNCPNWVVVAEENNCPTFKKQSRHHRTCLLISACFCLRSKVTDSFSLFFSS
jgi:acyl-ACP thioesterase